MGTVERRLAELGITLPTPAAPVANYVGSSARAISSSSPARSASASTASSRTPTRASSGPRSRWRRGRRRPGSAPSTCWPRCAAAIGDLDGVERCVRLGGFINADADLRRVPAVMNGASDLMVAVFGDKGRHARSTIGVAELPPDAAVEVEAIFEVR